MQYKEFTSQGSVKLSMKRNRVVDGKVELQVTVEDTGIGIDRDKFDRLFCEVLL